MKRILLKAAVGVGMAISASAAMAFDPSTTAPDYTVFISGSSAVSPTVLSYTIDTVCDHSADVSVFRRSSGNGFGNDWGVACKISTANTGVSTARNVLILKRDAGGSGYGVTPVTNATALDVIQTGSTSGNCPNAPTTQTTANGTSYNQYVCNSGNVSLIPDAGFSDVEPDKFRGFNAPGGLPDFNAANALPFQAQPVAALVFGIPVSKNLRDALQAVQFPKSSACNPVNAGYASSGETEACMPSLTKQEISMLYVGGIHNWDSFLVTDPSNPSGAKIPLATALNNDSQYAALGIVPTDHKVEICRRTPGSGTQATLGIEFLNAPCDPNAVPPLASPGNPFLGPVVAENSGASDVSRCLDDFSNGTNNSGQNSTNTHRWAAGVEFTADYDASHFDWRFVKISGVAPTIQNVAAGHYPYYSEESFQWRTDITTLHNATTTSDKNDTVTLMQFIASNAVTPSALAAINTSYAYSWGQGGWLAIPGTFTPSNPFNINNPVNTSTRAPFGNGPNTCQPPITVTSVPVDGPF